MRSCLTNITYLGHTRYGVRRKLSGVRNQIEGVELGRNPAEELIVKENTHEALISADLFHRVATTLKKVPQRSSGSGTGRGKQLLFSSAIVCSRCGAHYQCRPRKKGGREYDYYECSGPRSGRSNERCDRWSVNAEKLKRFIFGHIQRAVTALEFEAALKGYLVGRLGQLIRNDVMDTRHLGGDISAAEQKKGRLVGSIADRLLDPHDPTVAQKLREIDDELLMLTTRKQEVLKLAGGSLDPDLIAVQLIERVRDLAGLLESQDLDDQRKALFAFCKRIVADSANREIVIEADLTGLAQSTSPSGLTGGLCNLLLPDQDSNLEPSG